MVLYKHIGNTIRFNRFYSTTVLNVENLLFVLERGVSQTVIRKAPGALSRIGSTEIELKFQPNFTCRLRFSKYR